MNVGLGPFCGLGNHGAGVGGVLKLTSGNGEGFPNSAAGGGSDGGREGMGGKYGGGDAGAGGGIKSSTGGGGGGMGIASGARASDGGGANPIGCPVGGGKMGKIVKLGSGQKMADWHVTGEKCIIDGLLYAVCVALSSVLRSLTEAVWALFMGHGAADAL